MLFSKSTFVCIFLSLFLPSQVLACGTSASAQLKMGPSSLSFEVHCVRVIQFKDSWYTSQQQQLSSIGECAEDCFDVYLQAETVCASNTESRIRCLDLVDEALDSCMLNCE